MINWEALDRIEQEQREVFALPNLSTRYVPGECNVMGELPIAMVIGEAPGAQEDLKLRPFVGPAGVVLRDLIHSVGLNNVWITNVVKFRPMNPGNRTPMESEILRARPFLKREWQAIGKPDLIIPVGSPALRAVMGRRMSILKMAGQMIIRERNYGDPRVVYIWPMIHPSYGLRNKKLQPLLEKDWDKLDRWLYDIHLRKDVSGSNSNR